MKNLQVFSALEDNTICNSFSLERVTVHSAKACFFPRRTFPRPPKPRLQWKSPQMSMDQHGDSKQKREVWDLYGSTAALIFPTHLWFSTQPKTLCTSVCSLALVPGMFLSTCISAFLSFHILPFLSAGDCISPAVGQLVWTSPLLVLLVQTSPPLILHLHAAITGVSQEESTWKAVAYPTANILSGDCHPPSCQDVHTDCRGRLLD